MVERQQDDRGADIDALGTRGGGRGHHQRRRQKAVFVLMVLSEEEAIEARLLARDHLSQGILHTHVKIVAARRIGDRSVEPELHDDTRRAAARSTWRSPSCQVHTSV